MEHKKSWDGLAGRMEYVLEEIQKGREKLERKVESEIKEVTRKIDKLETMWRKKEVELLKRVDEKIREAEEMHLEEKKAREAEKKIWETEVMEKVEKKMQEDIRKNKGEVQERQGKSIDREMQKEVKGLKKKMELQERKEKRNNILIRGLNYNRVEAKKKVEELLEQKFGIKGGIKEMELKGRGQEIKVVEVKLESWEIKQEIMSRKGKLDLGKVFIDHDLTEEERWIQTRLREIAAKERSEDKEVRVRCKCIWIQGKRFDWNEEKREIEERKDFRLEPSREREVKDKE